jgi:hypothetical protein
VIQIDQFVGEYCQEHINDHSFLDHDLEGIGKSARQIFSKIFTDIHRRGHPKKGIQNGLSNFCMIQCTLQSL